VVLPAPIGPAITTSNGFCSLKGYPHRAVLRAVGFATSRRKLSSSPPQLPEAPQISQQRPENELELSNDLKMEAIVP
jgi:hypothetical protein